MAKKSKWLKGVDPCVAVSQAAQEAVQLRLASLESRLRAAALDVPQLATNDRDEDDDDVNAVHQLRVASRRAIAALDVFAPLLPPVKLAWIRKQLKRMRREAGEARDLDVLIERLKWQSQTFEHSGWQPLLERLSLLRELSQDPIETLYRRLRGGKFAQRTEALIRKIRWRDNKLAEPTLAEMARTELRTTSGQFFEHGAADLTDIERLHEFRIAGKRLRYAMELFAVAFSPEFKSELYPLIEQLQKVLGDVNDHAAAAQRYADWLAAPHDPRITMLLSKLLDDERVALAEKHGKFLDYWMPQRADDLRHRFDDLLSRPWANQVA